jgi:hypothetical protein
MLLPGAAVTVTRTAMSEKRTTPSTFATDPRVRASTSRKSACDAFAIARNVNRKQLLTDASSRCSGLQASPGPPYSGGGATVTSARPAAEIVAYPSGPPMRSTS